tara:strand:+ start:696 stop:1376 length:681 start_codon:yes stop_codon:yes gene_type:complete
MADKKISDLTELTTPASGDFLVVVDADTNETKKIKFHEITGRDFITSANVFDRFVQERANLDAIGASNIFLTGEIPSGSSFSGPGSDSQGPFDARWNSTTESTFTTLIRIVLTGITFETNETIKLSALGSTVRRTDQLQRGTFSVNAFQPSFSGPGKGSIRSFKVQVTDGSSIDNYIDTTFTGVQIQSLITVTGSGDSAFTFDNGSKVVDITDFTHTVKINNYDDD